MPSKLSVMAFEARIKSLSRTKSDRTTLWIYNKLREKLADNNRISCIRNSKLYTAIFPKLTKKKSCSAEMEKDRNNLEQLKKKSNIAQWDAERAQFEMLFYLHLNQNESENLKQNNKLSIKWEYQHPEKNLLNSINSIEFRLKLYVHTHWIEYCTSKNKIYMVIIQIQQKLPISPNQTVSFTQLQCIWIENKTKKCRWVNDKNYDKINELEWIKTKNTKEKHHPELDR